MSGHVKNNKWKNVSAAFSPRSRIRCFIFVCFAVVSVNRRLIFAVGNYDSLSWLFWYGAPKPRSRCSRPRTTPKLLQRIDLPRTGQTQHVVSRKKDTQKTYAHTLFHNGSSLQQRFDYWGRESLVVEVTKLQA